MLNVENILKTQVYFIKFKGIVIGMRCVPFLFKKT